MNNTEKKLLEALAYLADNVDEDCPTECRTTHLDEALHDARALMDKMNATTNGGTTMTCESLLDNTALDNRAKRSSITTHSRVLDNANTRKR